MIRILHITADFPDAFSVHKTAAVKNLLEGTPEFSHYVYSINRLNGMGRICLAAQNEDGATIIYGAPSHGILLEPFLIRLADWILKDFRERGKTVDIIHAHKLTIEGLIARRIAANLECPYVCTVRGNTDQKYIRMKPAMRRRWRRVAHEASWLFPVTPWIERFIRQSLSTDPERHSLLPTATSIDRFLPPRDLKQRLVTAFRLSGWKLKGMPNLLSAMEQLRQNGRPIGLDIIGGGSIRDEAALRREIEKRGLSDLVSLLGDVPHHKMLETLNGYLAFALPTLRETFGMVYIESLFAGTPILYSQGRGVDGFFDNMNVGIKCNPNSVESIMAGIELLVIESDRIKQELAELQISGAFDFFRQQSICEGYAERITSLISQDGPSSGGRLGSVVDGVDAPT